MQHTRHMQSDGTTRDVRQADVTRFYDALVFPSKTSHDAYGRLVPDDATEKKVGDFGCGQSLFIERFRSLGCNAVFLDISPRALSQIDYGTKILASLTDIPLCDGEMDYIFCIGVVHHIPDMEKAISELIRVLHPSGRLYLGVYANRTVQSFLRNCYESARSPILRSAIWILSGGLIWLRNRKNGLAYATAEHRKRIEDLLLTPLVRYAPVSAYAALVDINGGQLRETRRISQMNVLVVEKQ